MSKLRLILVTGRSLGQGQGKETWKFSRYYKENVAVCELDPEDLKSINVSSGGTVKVSTDFGSIVVKAMSSTQTPHRGIAFIPYGPWAQMVTDPTTQGTGMQTTKGLSATVEPSEDTVLDLQVLLEKTYEKGV